MLEELKDYLKITWNEEDTNLQNIINRGKGYLKGLTGTELEFDIEGPSRSLLLDYCRYDYNNATEYFEENFQRQIVRLQYQEALRVKKNDG